MKQHQQKQAMDGMARELGIDQLSEDDLEGITGGSSSSDDGLSFGEIEDKYKAQYNAYRSNGLTPKAAMREVYDNDLNPNEQDAVKGLFGLIGVLGRN